MTCGNDCDVRTFVGLEDDDVFEFSLSSSKLTTLACYTTPARLEGGGADVVAVAMDDNTVQAFTNDVSHYIYPLWWKYLLKYIRLFEMRILVLGIVGAPNW